MIAKKNIILKFSPYNGFLASVTWTANQSAWYQQNSYIFHKVYPGCSEPSCSKSSQGSVSNQSRYKDKRDHGTVAAELTDSDGLAPGVSAVGRKWSGAQVKLISSIEQERASEDLVSGWISFVYMIR